MKKGISITEWRDLEDGHLYNKGDEYPHDGRRVSDERLAELSGTQNKAGFALIRLVEAPNEAKAIEAPEAPKKPTRSRKKTI